MKEKKTERVYVRLSEQDKNVLEKRAEKFGVSMSDYIKKMALESDPFLIAEENIFEVRELRKEGNEIKRTLNLHHDQKMKYKPFLERMNRLFKRATK